MYDLTHVCQGVLDHRMRLSLGAYDTDSMCGCKKHACDDVELWGMRLG